MDGAELGPLRVSRLPILSVLAAADFFAMPAHDPSAVQNGVVATAATPARFKNSPRSSKSSRSLLTSRASSIRTVVAAI